MKAFTSLLILIFAMSLSATWSTPSIAQEGGKEPEHSVFGVGVTPYGALTITRPFDVQDYSVGVKVGAEFDFSPLFAGVSIKLHDILVEDRGEVYPFDGELEISLGAYW